MLDPEAGGGTPPPKRERLWFEKEPLEFNPTLHGDDTKVLFDLRDKGIMTEDELDRAVREKVAENEAYTRQTTMQLLRKLTGDESEGAFRAMWWGDTELGFTIDLFIDILTKIQRQQSKTIEDIYAGIDSQ